MGKLKIKIPIYVNIPRSERVGTVTVIFRQRIHKKHYGESVKFSVPIYLGKLEHLNNIGASIY